jgi:hypothetical protein
VSDLRTELQAVHDRNGRLTPAILVEEARPKQHPLHPVIFDRPVKDAAEAYYRSRAQEVIQSVKITYRTDPDAEPKSTRAFVAVQRGGTDNRGFVYEPAEQVARDDAALEAVLDEMQRDWKMLKARYSRFAEFAELVREDSLVAA